MNLILEVVVTDRFHCMIHSQYIAVALTTALRMDTLHSGVILGMD